MSENTTSLSCSEATLERFNELKAALDAEQSNVPDHTANSFLNCLMDTYEAVEDEKYQDESRAEIIGDIREQLENLDGQQETLDGKREILNRIDDLETELTTRLEQLQR